eukprot:CAMPEP_0185317306 /NCGR_PEP_ID=MMETSP1363-20130426/46448_1 /TAXON_ID=38817 /ORGANISM="Gephyrocapsa oceanica, Strain RCC1303" /LENGTH=66 /DNA_ID=CAMNT_0027915557 /DNA_START=831 /DNA_END=1028 /DNA_ORIENTATION=+
MWSQLEIAPTSSLSADAGMRSQLEMATTRVFRRTLWAATFGGGGELHTAVSKQTGIMKLGPHLVMG